MASNDFEEYSDDMIREGLLKLGITDVEPTLIEQIKSDLREKSQGFTSTDGTKHSSIDSNVEVAAKKVVSAVTMTLDPEAEMRHRSHFQRESRGLSSGNLSMPSNTDSGTEIPNMLTRKVMRKSASGKPFATLKRLPLLDFKGPNPVQQDQNVPNPKLSSYKFWPRKRSVSVGASEKSRQYGKGPMTDLAIIKLSHYSAPVCGGTNVILLSNRVAKEDTEIWFYETVNNCLTWQCRAEFDPTDVHKQVAISFRTPKYHNENVQQPVAVFIVLRRPSDNLRGEPRQFQFLPIETAQQTGLCLLLGTASGSDQVLQMSTQFASMLSNIIMSAVPMSSDTSTAVHSPGMGMSPRTPGYGSSVPPLSTRGMTAVLIEDEALAQSKHAEIIDNQQQCLDETYVLDHQQHALDETYIIETED